MKIAFFSDVHANWPAFQSFLEDLERTRPDMVYCLGDLVGYNVWANDVVDEVRRRRFPTIMGNHDEVAPEPPEVSDQSNRGLTGRLLTPETRTYLRSLPRHLKLSFRAGKGLLNMLLVHGSPKAINDYLVQDYPEEEVLSMMEQEGADVLLCGHTHIPYHRIIKKDARQLHVINIGSVGKPKDGDPRLCYAIMTMADNPSIGDLDAIQVTFRRLEYDVEAAMQAVRNSDFPDAFADALKQAR